MERHGRTGRLAWRCPLAGVSLGTMLVDKATGVVLMLYRGGGGTLEFRLETAGFEVTAAGGVDAGIFGEETLEAPDFYHGALP